MAEKKKEEAFVVTDRRLFTPEGELRQEVVEDVAQPAKPGPQRVEAASPPAEADVQPAPSASEQKQQADAYRRSKKDLDSRVEPRACVIGARARPAQWPLCERYGDDL